MRSQTQLPRRQQKGFTLIESLISLIVLSIGLLGIAALFFEGLKSGRTAIFRTEAVYLAGDLADRIRANPAGLDSYELDGNDDVVCVGKEKNCDGADMAIYDRYIWEKEIASLMPGGTTFGVTFTDGDPVDTYTISINWLEPGFVDANGDPAPLNYTLEFVF